jgi:hypothetical protein
VGHDLTRNQQPRGLSLDYLRGETRVGRKVIGVADTHVPAGHPPHCAHSWTPFLAADPGVIAARGPLRRGATRRLAGVDGTWSGLSGTCGQLESGRTQTPQQQRGGNDPCPGVSGVHGGPFRCCRAAALSPTMCEILAFAPATDPNYNSRTAPPNNPFKLTHYRRCPSLDATAHAMVFSAPS